MGTPSELNLAAEWGSTPPSVVEFFNGQFTNLQAILEKLEKRHAVRADELGRLHDKEGVQDALKDILHIQERARMGDVQPARDHITAELGRVVLEKAAYEQKLKAPRGTLHEDGYYDQLKLQQQATGTELQRFKVSGMDQQFPVILDAAERKLEQVKYDLMQQTERGRTEDGQRQTVQQEAHLRSLLQSLPRSK